MTTKKPKHSGGDTKNLDVLEGALKHPFADRGNLERALIHRSFAHEKGTPGHDSELLEFLGDAVLGLEVSQMLLRRFPEAEVGEMARMRAFLVSEANLARKARRLNLGGFLRLGRGEERSGGRDKGSLLADAYEAVLAAIYLDGGPQAAQGAISRHFNSQIARMGQAARVDQDCKTDLQEALQAEGFAVPVYRVSAETGPDHHKSFCVELVVAENIVARGTGNNKKAAEQMAARRALGGIKRLMTRLKDSEPSRRKVRLKRPSGSV